MKITSELERAILAVRAGTLLQQGFVAALVASQIAVPSRTAMSRQLSEIQPILLDKGKETFVAAFSSTDYARVLQDLAGFCIRIEALAWLRVIPRGIGLVLNPGMPAEFQISAAGVQQIVRNYSPEPIQ